MSRVKQVLRDMRVCMFCGARTGDWMVCDRCDDINGGDGQDD